MSQGGPQQSLKGTTRFSGTVWHALCTCSLVIISDVRIHRAEGTMRFQSTAQSLKRRPKYCTTESCKRKGTSPLSSPPGRHDSSSSAVQTHRTFLHHRPWPAVAAGTLPAHPRLTPAVCPKNVNMMGSCYCMQQHAADYCCNRLDSFRDVVSLYL